MKDLSGTYRHERFHQLWEVEKEDDAYIIHAYTLSDSRERLGTSMSTIAEYLHELIRKKDLTLVEEKKSVMRKLMKKFW
ncbi:hypothetical protein [Chryseolinea lacunae]|uniref:HTH crp-type domain-containing protein n=1 Tax=Chryseolinea lacunae TaxID=2801331 RepID=A0ABS1KYN0_9BACT|nr:hypothetical protein [Chryseolinea lacunae]MBL0744569.1 hypothetical protein [Chryseolinea lacunae]